MQRIFVFCMKNRVFLGLLAVLCLFLSACESSNDCKYRTTTLDITVQSPDWKFDDDTKQYYYHAGVPEITSQIYNYGNWTICREYFARTADAYQVALPQSEFMVEEQTDEETGKSYLYYYTRYIDYRVGVGYVEIQVTNSDYYYDTKNPESMTFRLQLIY